MRHRRSPNSSFQGTAQEFEASFKGMWLLMAMAILVIYIVLGILYESFIHPLTILSGLPAAGVGALLTLLLFDTSLSIYAFVGIIMLIGIVKKNAIMMIDFALMVQRRENKSPAEAIYQGCILRFRPIMMTTMAALMGSLPIALGFGAGAEARRPLGLAVVGGLLLSQLLTLYITPARAAYVRFHKAEARAQERYVAGDWAGMIAALREALEHRRDDPQTLFNLASAQMRSDALVDAETSLRRILALDLGPTESRFKVFSHYHLGRVLDLQGRREEALAEYRAVLALPDPSDAHRLAEERILSPATREQLE